MAVTANPSSITNTIANYRATTGRGLPLTHVGLVSTAPGSVATPGVAGGFFDVWYDPTNNNLILDYTSTQA